MRFRGGGRPFTLLSALGLLSAAVVFPCSTEAGTVSGLVTADGPAARNRLDTKATPVPVAVWIEGPNVSVPPAERPTLSQRNVQFSSPLLVVVSGQTVDMPNEDEVAHNVYSPSAAKRFNLGIYGKGETKSVTFDQVGLIDILCSIHRRMSAKILVVPNPYYALTAVEGRYQIRGVPAGRYSLHAWSKSFLDAQQEIVVPENGEVTLNLALARAK